MSMVRLSKCSQGNGSASERLNQITSEIVVIFSDCSHLFRWGTSTLELQIGLWLASILCWELEEHNIYWWQNNDYLMRRYHGDCNSSLLSLLIDKFQGMVPQEYLHEDSVQRNTWWKFTAHINTHMNISSCPYLKIEHNRKQQKIRLLSFIYGNLHKAIALESILFWVKPGA